MAKLDESVYRPTFPDSPFIHIADLVDQTTGKTHREMNNERHHAIPIGALVEVKFDTWFGDGACWKVHARMWVAAHTRDCDGAPLYSISRWKDPAFAMPDRALHGFSEESLTVVEITDKVRNGDDSLSWDEAPLGEM